MRKRSLYITLVGPYGIVKKSKKIPSITQAGGTLRFLVLQTALISLCTMANIRSNFKWSVTKFHLYMSGRLKTELKDPGAVVTSEGGEIKIFTSSHGWCTAPSFISHIHIFFLWALAFLNTVTTVLHIRCCFVVVVWLSKRNFQNDTLTTC